MYRNRKEKKIEAELFTAGGAIAGASVSNVVGGMGLAVAGTGIGIGVGTVATFGAVAGMAAYGVKKAFFDSK
ncbi:MAG: hypothetical protein AAF383_18175 [Cyanobacteria bacterium P01_A01_bin.83]